MGFKILYEGPRCKYLRILNHLTREASFKCVMGHYPGPPDKQIPNKCTGGGRCPDYREIQGAPT